MCVGGTGSQIRSHAGYAQYLGNVLGAAGLSPHLRVLVAGIMYHCVMSIGPSGGPPDLAADAAPLVRVGVGVGGGGGVCV